MTISNTSPSVTIECDGATVNFNYGFLIPFQADGITPAVVVNVIAPDGSFSVLPPYSYSISGVNNPAGGSVGYLPPAGPLPAGYAISIARSLSLVQSVALPNLGFYPRMAEHGLDLIVMMLQDLAASAVTVLPGDTPPTLPTAGVRAGDVAGWDANGDFTSVNLGPLISAALSGLAILSSDQVLKLITAYIQTLPILYADGAGYTVIAGPPPSVVVQLIAGVDNAPFIQSALNTGANVSLRNPATGTPLWLSKVSLTTTGQVLTGQGRLSTQFRVSSGYDTTADCLLSLEAPGCQVSDIGWFCDQIGVTTRAGLVPYPYIVALKNERPRLSRLRISAAPKGINGQFNCGGAILDDLELGCFTQDMVFDGALDSVRLRAVHHWPFGISASNALMNIYTDNNHVAALLLRVDDLQADEWFVYAGSITLSPGATGNPGAEISNISFDTFGKMVINAGTLEVGRCALNSASAIVPLTITGGEVVITTLILNQSYAGITPLVVSGGYPTVNGGNFGVSDAGTRTAQISGGYLSLANMRFDFATNKVRSVPMIEQTAQSRLHITSCKVSDAGSGSGAFVKLFNDSNHTISLNDLSGGWTINKSVAPTNSFIANNPGAGYV